MEISVGEPSSAGFEALSVLRAAAEHTAGPLSEQLAERALRVTERADFAMAQAALEALLRRLTAARESRAIVSRAGRGALGWYRVGRRGGDAPHHHVLLSSVAPIGGSCSCSDYARASLGLCKHIFLVASGRAGRKPAVEPPPLRWDPVRPLTGVGDWLERLTWRAPSARAARESRLRRLFRPDDEGRLCLPPTMIVDPTARLAAIEALIELVRARDRVAEPAVLALLERDRQLLTRVVRRGLTPKEVRRHCEGLKQPLLLYQREGVRRFLERGRLLLADDMGLGKTAQAIAACHVLVAAGRARRGLVVVPAPLQPQWEREWKRFTDLPLNTVDEGLEARVRPGRRAAAEILLVTYEHMVRQMPPLRRFRPDIVVLDEAQRVDNWAIRMAPHLAMLDTPWRLVLTSASMEDRLDDLASIMEWVDESALEPRWRLASWHTSGDGRSAFTGARNLETLRQRLAPSMVRRVRRDVLEQLPARRDTRVSLSLTQAQRAAHDELNQPLARIMARAARRPPSQADVLRLIAHMTRQRIICNGMAHRDFMHVWPSIERRAASGALMESLASPKLGELRELVAAIAIAQERKVVVFSQWRRMLRIAAWAVADVLRSAGVRAVLVTGDESARRRTQSAAAFRHDRDVRVLFATDAGRIGLDLQRASSCCIHLDVPWNPAVLDGRIDSVQRPGDGQPVENYALVAEGGVEGRIADLVESRRALLGELFVGTRDTFELEQAESLLAAIAMIVPGAAVEVDVEGEPEPLDPGTRSSEGEVPDEMDLDDLPASPPAPGSVASLFDQILVKHLPEGRVTFEAPAAAAAALVEVMQGIARLFAANDPGAAEGLSS